MICGYVTCRFLVSPLYILIICENVRPIEPVVLMNFQRPIYVIQETLRAGVTIFSVRVGMFKGLMNSYINRFLNKIKKKKNANLFNNY